jgi:hypothetical protein
VHVSWTLTGTSNVSLSQAKILAGSVLATSIGLHALLTAADLHHEHSSTASQVA